MARKAPAPQPIRMLYCPNCHLATRASCQRCLHCGGNLSEGRTDNDGQDSGGHSLLIKTIQGRTMDVR
jgi:hypothetical protein